MTDRPEPPNPAPPGYRWQIAEAVRWRPCEGKRCRYTVGPKRASCGQPSVAELDRSSRSNTRQTWWAYCPEHLFLNWIEDGRVVHWGLVEEVERG